MDSVLVDFKFNLGDNVLNIQADVEPCVHGKPGSYDGGVEGEVEITSCELVCPDTNARITFCYLDLMHPSRGAKNARLVKTLIENAARQEVEDGNGF